jgi:zinc D-Ala-D-Ala carboxypeptidase
MELNYFKLSEFNSPDVKGSGENMDTDFLLMLDEARDIADVAFKINSGYRTPEHNEKVGGVSSSSHLSGLAADIHCNDSVKRFIIVNALILAGFTRIGIAKTFIHVDNDPSKTGDVIWVY